MTLGHTQIPYLTRLWHPTTGCSRGCPTCWARPLVCNRLAGTMRGLPDGDPFCPTFHADRLADPLRTRKPQVIGVSFLGDLFDPAIADEEIAAVFGVMAAAQQHTFVVLTKQAERMTAWFRWLGNRGWNEQSFCSCAADMRLVRHEAERSACRPLPNVWLGVSVTDRDDFDERVHLLCTTPAAHRWISYEPAIGDLGPISEWLVGDGAPCLLCGATGVHRGQRCPDCLDGYVYGLNLVILGGESGPGARPLHPDWVRSVRDQCAAAGVPFAFKQDSGFHPTHRPFLDGVQHWDLPWAVAP